MDLSRFSEHCPLSVTNPLHCNDTACRYYLAIWPSELKESRHRVDTLVTRPGHLDDADLALWSQSLSDCPIFREIGLTA